MRQPAVLPTSPMSSVGGSSPHKKRKNHNHPVLSSSTALLLIFTNGLSFLSGTFFGSNFYSTPTITNQRRAPALVECPPPIQCPECEACPVCPPEKDCPPPKACPPCPNKASSFPSTVNRFAYGFAHTTKENFTHTYDLGVPDDPPQKEGDSGVLILYNGPESMPPGAPHSTHTPLTAAQATQNCDQMNVVFLYHEQRRKQCLAIVPQYESFHLQKWMRVPEEGRDRRPNQPLRLVPRGMALDMKNDQLQSAFHPPHHEKHTLKHWKMLEKYLDSIDHVLDELRPIVNEIQHDNAVVVMVCNLGQSQLLLNFACAARSKGLDTSMVLVFATDRETKELAEGVGLTVFWDERNFGSMPKKAAQVYGDGAFTNMMLSKVICVHMVMLLGVDLLFQDVDVIWYQNPLEYFTRQINHRTPLFDFDAYFQDDGSRSLRFAPYSANSGFYYFRNNDRTRYFSTSLLMQSDLILRSFSHQSAMTAVLSEHSSLMGLRVKILPPLDFPAGFLYHKKKGRGGPYGTFFWDLVKGNRPKPKILHMSWTENKHNKILFYRQLGEWYLQDKCMDTELKDIEGVVRDDKGRSNNFGETCCAVEALFSCHFSDKPSSKPCKDSPTLDKNGVSFW